MTKKAKAKRDVTVTVSMTERQRTAMEEFAADWDINKAAIGRRLIQHLIAQKAALPELLRKYRAASASEDLALTHSYPIPKDFLRKKHRVCIRLTQDEKQRLNVLAGEGFYLPGELAGILLELFISGVIKKSDIWR